MKTFLQATATEEGLYVIGSRPARNLNPGDLIWGPEAHAFGATHGDLESEAGYAGYAGFAVFAKVEDGWKALQRWYSVPAILRHGPVAGFPFCDPNGTTLVGGYLGATLAQCIYRFAPPSQNNTERYISTVTTETGLLRTVLITEAILQTPEAL
jgi:hypothetical protein